MLLQHKTAVVYGGGGFVGGAIARALAREGATVHLAGRTAATLQVVADDIAAAGGQALVAVEAMRRQQAAELGPHGIRVVTLRTGGLPETIPADFEGYEQVRRWLVDQTLTGRTATLADVGNVAAFAASELARTVTGTINMTAGAVLD